MIGPRTSSMHQSGHSDFYSTSPEKLTKTMNSYLQREPLFQVSDPHQLERSSWAPKRVWQWAPLYLYVLPLCSIYKGLLLSVSGHHHTLPLASSRTSKYPDVLYQHLASNHEFPISKPTAGAKASAATRCFCCGRAVPCTTSVFADAAVHTVRGSLTVPS